VEEVYFRFGAALARVRREKGLTQAELATRVGVARSSVVQLERGKQRVQLHTLVDLAGALGVTSADLLPDAPPTTSEIERQVEGLPGPAREWVMRVVAPSGSS
jgi:transcriptional regulator with XRE-family HTH domain